MPAGCSVSAAELNFPDINYRTDKRISRAAYWRFAIPRFLQGRYAKALYLDIDVLPVSASLFGCFDYNLKGRAIAAARGMRSVLRSPNATGFNSGVMLIDIDRYMRAGISQTAFELIRSDISSMTIHDQSVLNAAAEGQWIELSMSFNFWAGALRTEIEKMFPPKIIHYVGDFKPWHIVTPYPRHPMRSDLISSLVRRGHWRVLTRGLHLRRLLKAAQKDSSGELVHRPDNRTRDAAGP